MANRRGRQRRLDDQRQPYRTQDDYNKKPDVEEDWDQEMLASREPVQGCRVTSATNTIQYNSKNDGLFDEDDWDGNRSTSVSSQHFHSFAPDSKVETMTFMRSRETKSGERFRGRGSSGKPGAFNCYETEGQKSSRGQGRGWRLQGNGKSQPSRYERDNWREPKCTEPDWQENGDHETYNQEKDQRGLGGRGSGWQANRERDSFSQNINEIETLGNKMKFNDDYDDDAEIKISSKHVGLVIGRGGSKIRELQDKSSAKISVEKDSINSEGMVSVKINGDSCARQNAKKLIQDLIDSELNRGSNLFGGQDERHENNTLCMEVPSNVVGKIIGKGGSKINDLQLASEAKIKVLRDKCGATTMIRISGTDAARALAEELINALISNAGQDSFPFNDRCQANTLESTQPEMSSSDVAETKRSGWSDDETTTLNANESDWSYNCSKGSKASRTWPFGNNLSCTSDNKPVRADFIDWDKIREEDNACQETKWKDYPPVKKDFYIEDEDVANLDPHEVEQIRRENNKIMVKNLDSSIGHIPNPVCTFAEAFGHYPEIMEELQKAGFEKPSPIQMQAWPIILQGRDLIGIAQTGTGKTLAFLLPAFIHIEGQPADRNKRGGANVLVLTPTRELALQIEEEVKKYKYKDIKCVCIYGGGDRKEQINVVTSGVEIIVATPGRLIDLISHKIVDVKSVTYLILDEADRMLDLGFQPDIRKILLDIRPQRQTIMTSATWPEGVRYMATNYMNNPVQVFVGSMDLTACHSVLQRVIMVDEEAKLEKLVDILENEVGDDGKVIVFMGRKATVDYVSTQFIMREINCQSIHGSREQFDREQALDDLKSGEVNILLATDVASRGIDIKDVTHVINYDFPHNIEEYVHRVGRTGRAGRTGQSITFMARNDWRYAQNLIDIMAEAKQEVPQSLYDMAARFAVHQERRRQEGGNRANRRGESDFEGEFGSFQSGRGNRRGGKKSFGFSVGYM